MKWEKASLGSLCIMKYGKMPNKQELVDEGYPVFSGYRVTGYHKEYLFKEPQLIVVARGVGGTGDVKISPPFCYLTNLSIASQTNDDLVELQEVCRKKSLLEIAQERFAIVVENLQRIR